METKNRKHLFEGPIPAKKVGDMAAKHQEKTDIGAHTFFIGQVRADKKNGKAVVLIEYSAYEDMAENVIHDIKEEAFQKFDLGCLHIYHSIGEVKVREISLVVMVSSAHRAPTLSSLEWIVDQIKEKVPIWKKEVFEDGSYGWLGVKKLASGDYQ